MRSTTQIYHEKITLARIKHKKQQKKTHYKYLFKRAEEEKKEDVLHTNICSVDKL